MSDRELVQKAAKACGKEIDLDRYDDEMGFVILGISRWWNPLVNDGDAFRLMVKLGLFGSPEVAHHRTLAHIFENCPDDSAVYRRAITRAAAEIQRAKEAGNA